MSGPALANTRNLPARDGGIYTSNQSATTARNLPARDGGIYTSNQSAHNVCDSQMSPGKPVGRGDGRTAVEQLDGELSQGLVLHVVATKVLGLGLGIRDKGVWGRILTRISGIVRRVSMVGDRASRVEG